MYFEDTFESAQWRKAVTASPQGKESIALSFCDLPLSGWEDLKMVTEISYTGGH